MNVIQPYISNTLKQTLNDIYQSIAPHFETNTNLINNQLNFKKESHYLELGETGLMKNLSTTGG